MRQQELGKEAAFLAEAAFAKPEIYEALEERGVKYAMRIPVKDSQGTIHGHLHHFAMLTVGPARASPFRWMGSPTGPVGTG